MPWHPITPPSALQARALDELDALSAHVNFFNPAEPIVLTRAPGRLDLMGGIADYSGALVLELPLASAALVLAQADPRPAVTIRSLQAAAIDAAPEVSIPLAELTAGGRPLPYAEARARLAADPRAHWAAYIVGALVVLGHERGLAPAHGVRLLVDSQVPPGKGVSSSAAIEVAALQALAAIYGVTVEARTLALLCQQAENLVVGAPCGVMDQMTVACGEAGALLALRCQPAELEPAVALPAGLAVWGLDSGIRHAVSGADYGSVRVGAFMGYRIIAELAGLAVRPVGGGRVAVDDPRWGGYLANITPAEWAQHYRERLPETIEGEAFLTRYGGTTDAVTRVDPARVYALRQPTEHPIMEHHRVRLFRALLRGEPGEEERRLLGELMYQSHASYSACGLGSDGTDRLVELARSAGPAAGIYGAKITGGGSGGTVAVLGRAEAGPAVRAIAEEYGGPAGRAADILHGSSPGAAAFGALWLRLGA